MSFSQSSKFDTASAAFSRDYHEKSLHQKSFNTYAIEYIAEMVQKWFPNETELCILDLCCGDGSSTRKLLDALLENNIKVKQLVGYDISADQIAFANKNYANPQLLFKEANAEKLEEKQRFHLIVSFFGFHWLEQIQHTVPRLHDALLPDGRVAFLVPLEKETLYQLRQECMASAAWQDKFKGYTLSPFHYSALDYTEPFTEYFMPEIGNVTDDRIKHFSKADFCQFLESWLQEERYLRAKFGENIAKQYVVDLVNSISESPYRYAYLSKDDKETIQFVERYLFWQGKRRLTPIKSMDLLDILPLTHLQSTLTKGFISFFQPKSFISSQSETHEIAEDHACKVTK